MFNRRWLLARLTAPQESIGLTLLLLAVAALATGSLVALQDPLVLEGATVIDTTAGRSLPDRTIVIEGDRILSINGADRTSYPPTASRLDLAGRFILPGLIESHVHWEDWMGELYLNHGVTSVVALENLEREKRNTAWQSLSFPRIFHSGNRPRISVAMNQQQVQEAIAVWLRNEPAIGHLPTFNPEISRVYRWAAEEIHKAGFFVFGHAENAPNAIEAGLDVVEHVWGFTQAQMSTEELERFQRGEFLTWATFMNDWQRLDEMIRSAVERNIYLNPTLLYEWGGMSKLAARHEYEDYLLFSDPDLSYFPRNIAQSLLAKHRQIKNFSNRHEIMPRISQLTPQDRQQFQNGYQKVQQFVRRYVAAGGKIHSGTDAPSGGTPGLSLHHEMEVLVEAGLTPAQALRSSTVWPAEMLAGKDGRLGHPRVGYLRAGDLADLVVLTANPLEDIRNTRKIERVMKNGVFVELGYHPTFFTFTSTPRTIVGASPLPELSAIGPHRVLAGSSQRRLVVEGVGFISNSQIRLNGMGVTTRFEGPRRLSAMIPDELVAQATPNRFRAPGPAQRSDVYGDRTISVTVFNPPPEGGLSNSISLVVKRVEVPESQFPILGKLVLGVESP